MAEGIDTSEGVSSGIGQSDASGDIGENESEEDIHARHKREMKELKGRIQALKKSVSKGDKKRKKEITTEIAQLEAEIQSRHETELTQHTSSAAGSNSITNDGSNEEMSVASVISSTGDMKLREGEGEVQRKSKSQKKKERKQRQEQERERRIAEGEVEETNTSRYQERQKLLSLLEPQGLTIKDIQPDGNCLYSAVSDQLELLHGKKISVERLREECGSHIEANADLFMSFITNPDTGDACTPEYFHSYCTEIKETAAWGGEAELVALSQIYKLPIVIYQSEAPALFIGDGDKSEKTESLKLSYHSHEFSLGKHYNSVIPKT
ncbi:PREDICTED: OTU domain-containing protein 6B-like [Amphimedon queenslandica]|uniref:OTU domain-containing protein n=1 Tax=Amphimedon queenslandica TaxID=400682 RepID=A0A1X7U8D3_AMPQE|nr:PREDICTED: OTU domain-containing protein 6B-like [Amphimedon queenslandica]|eukprot:XP_019855506.1 PREDICTED: OTU domain-containing protein 6B-like [Amphimedon queenslandica]